MKAIAAAIIIALVGLLLVGIQQMRVDDLREEKLFETQAKDEAIKANTEGTGYTPNAELNPPTPAACA